MIYFTSDDTTKIPFSVEVVQDLLIDVALLGDLTPTFEVNV